MRPKGLIAAVGAMGAALGVSAPLAYGGGASIKVSVSGTKLTVSGNAGGKIGNYGQVYFDSRPCAGTLREEEGRGSTGGDVLTPPDGGAFHESWPIKALTEGPAPIQRYVCAYVVGINEEGMSVELAFAKGALPVHEAKRKKR